MGNFIGVHRHAAPFLDLEPFFDISAFEMTDEESRLAGELRVMGCSRQDKRGRRP